jgi:hypothetical protein
MAKNTAPAKKKKAVVPQTPSQPPLPPVPANDTEVTRVAGTDILGNRIVPVDRIFKPVPATDTPPDTRVQAKFPELHTSKAPESNPLSLSLDDNEKPIPIPAEPPVPTVETLSNNEQFWRDASEHDVEFAYQALNLANRDLTTLASFELVIVSRNGAIAERKKLEAQDQGRMAEVRMVQAELERLARQYAILKLAETSLPATLSDLNNKRRPEMPMEIVIRVAGEEVVITQQLLHQMAPSYSSGQNLFMQGVKNICTTAQHAITTAQSKANNGNGKNYGLPFDFQSPMSEIRNKHLAHGDQ